MPGPTSSPCTLISYRIVSWWWRRVWMWSAWSTGATSGRTCWRFIRLVSCAPQCGWWPCGGSICTIAETSCPRSLTPYKSQHRQATIPLHPFWVPSPPHCTLTICCTAQATNLKAVEQCNPGVARKCILSGRSPGVGTECCVVNAFGVARSSKVGHRLPCGGGGFGFGSIPWGNKSDDKINAGEKGLREALEVQAQVWALFPRQYAALLAVNQSAGLLASDGHATHGQSPVPNLAGISHMHITSKGLKLGGSAKGFSCKPHRDGDFKLTSTSSASTFSLGAWWPVGLPGSGCAFGYHGHMCSLSRPVAACFNSQLPHCSITCTLGPGDDVLGTSTEISTRDVLHCDKRAGNKTHVHN